MGLNYLPIFALYEQNKQKMATTNMICPMQDPKPKPKAKATSCGLPLLRKCKFAFPLFFNFSVWSP